MKIEIYIAQLLYRYQCVTVPGFGAFLTEIQSAQLEQGSHSFSPPTKKIAFNANLKNNDGLLANHIALTEKTSYEYAVSAIQYEVFNWKKTLEENTYLTLKNIGDLRLNGENNIVFTPFNQTNYLTSSFGLAPFISPQVVRVTPEQVVDTPDTVKTVTFIPTEPRTLSPYLKYAAVFVLGLGLVGSVGYPMYENQVVSQTLVVKTAVQKQVQNKIQEATFIIENPIPAVTLTVKPSKKATLPYHIMAGVYRDEKNANTSLKNLKKLGFPARRIAPNKNGYYPVLYGSYTTFAEAEKAKKEINDTHNPEAWILIASL